MRQRRNITNGQFPDLAAADPLHDLEGELGTNLFERGRKGVALRLDLHSLLPRFVLVESAKAADSIRAAQLCAGVKPGEIVIFDRAYVDFVHLGVLHEEGVFWVTRSKESLSFKVVKRLPKGN